MAVAWSKDKVGRANGDVTIRDPVVLTATLPRFLLNGDHSSAIISKSTMSKVRRAIIASACRRPVRYPRRVACRSCSCAPSSAAPPPYHSRRPLPAAPRSRSRSRDRAATQLERNYTLVARAATQTLTRRTVRPIARGESVTLTRRYVCRLRAGNRQRRAVDRSVDRARCGDPAQGARPLSVRLFRADHEPRDAAPLRQRTGDRSASGAGQRHRPAHQGRDRTADGAAGLQRLVRPVVGRRRRRVARRLRHRFPDAGTRKEFRGARWRFQARARSAAKFCRQCAGPEQGWRQRSCLCALRARTQWRRADRRPALCGGYQARRHRDADCEGANRALRSACSAIGCAPSGFMPLPSRPSCRRRATNMAAPTMARCCAMRRQS